MGVAAVGFTPPLTFSVEDQDKYSAFISRKSDARSSVRKAIVQNAYAPTSGEKLHKTARLTSEMDMGLAAVRFLVEKGFQSGEINDILQNVDANRAIWNEFKTSRQARSAVNQFDYLYTHSQDIPKGAISKMVKVSRFLRLFGDLLISRTSLTSRTVRSVTGTSEKTSVYSMPLFFGSAMLTNFLGVTLRDSAKVITATIVSVIVFSAGAICMAGTRVALKFAPRKRLTENDLKIAQFRAKELISNLAKTAHAQQKVLSTEQRTMALRYVDEKIAYTENTLFTQFKRKFITGDYRAARYLKAADIKVDMAHSVLSLPVAQCQMIGVIEQIRENSIRAKNYSDGDYEAYQKGQDYVFQGLRAAASLISGPQRNAQKLVVPGLKYADLDKLEAELGNADHPDVIQRRAKIEERLDWQYTSHFAKRSYLFKKKALAQIADWVKVHPLDVSSKSVRSNKISNLRQQYARWLTYDSKGDPSSVKTWRAFESCPSQRHRRAKTLEYAVNNSREYGPFTRILLRVGKASEEFSWKFALPMTGHTSRFLDKHLFKMIKHEQGIVTRSTFSHGGGASLWIGLNLIAFPPMAILFGGIGLFDIISTTALGAMTAIPAVIAYTLAYPLIHADWKGPV
ncbi:MAG: hypothetical protein QE278_09185 [Limnobacter sp.]|nr:hypothetical protein [Limnobacter sp.]